MNKPDVVILTRAVVLPANLLFRYDSPHHKEFINRFSTRSIGAFQIAHHLRTHGFTCQVVSFLDEFSITEINELLEKTVGENSIIGLSSVFQPWGDDQFMKDVLLLARKKFPNNKIVVGGRSATGLSTDFKFDAYFEGYSDDSFLEYVETHYKKRRPRIFTKLLHGAPIINSDTCLEKRFDIEKLDHQWHNNDCVVENEILPIEISRGCIFKCDFCSHRLNGKKKFDYIRDPNCIFNEMLYNYQQWGITKYQFMDDTFNDSTYKVQMLHDVFVKLPFKLEFWAYVRADLLHAHPEQITLLKNMGLRSTFFGIESFNQQSASSIGKGLKTEKLTTLLDSLYHKHWPDVAVMCGFIIGLPHETVGTQQDTFAWQKQHPNWVFSNHVLGLNASGDNDSAIAADPESYGYTWSKDYTTHPNWESRRVKHFWINNTGMTEAQAQELLEEYLHTSEIDPFTLPRQFLYSGLGQYDFTKPKEELFQTLLADYNKFITRYKEKLYTVVNSYA